MGKDATYTNGVIAVREKYLLNDRIYRLCETDAKEALRTLIETGFGRGTEISSVYEFEKLVSADEADTDAFIREYAPSRAEAEYLLSPQDFHNAKALVKAHCLKLDPEKLLAPEGMIPVSVISNCISDGNYAPLGKALSKAVEEAVKLFTESETAVSGAVIGNVFEKAKFTHLKQVCFRNPLLKKLLVIKADTANILTALRSGSFEHAQSCFAEGGRLDGEQLKKLFYEDKEKALRSFDGTGYEGFIKKCFSAQSQGLPLTEAEKFSESFEMQYFSERRHELKANQPFLYYVFRRRAENANVRILFVCLLAGMSGNEIKKRLR